MSFLWQHAKHKNVVTFQSDEFIIPSALDYVKIQILKFVPEAVQILLVANKNYILIIRPKKNKKLFVSKEAFSYI